MQNVEKYVAIVDEQEQKLRLDRMNYSDALELGLIAISLSKERYSKPVSVRIDVDNVTAFCHFMDGTNLHNDWWMKKKLNGCLKTGRSSFMNFLTVEASDRKKENPWSLDDGNFATVGGCFPLRMRDGELLGYMMVSGLDHEEDHQLIVDALSQFLHTEVSTVLDGGSFK